MYQYTTRKPQISSFLVCSNSLLGDRIGGLTVGVLASNAVDRGFEP